MARPPRHRAHFRGRGLGRPGRLRWLAKPP
jgi:hypothetical protein